MQATPNRTQGADAVEKTPAGFTDEERAAMQERAGES